MALSPNSPNTDNSMEALKQYGSYIITAILLALAGYFGWSYWQNNHARVDTVAADHYADIQKLNDEVSLAAQNPDLETEALATLNENRAMLDKDIDALVSTHGESIYAWQALMIKARAQVDNDKFADAKVTLDKARKIELGDAGLQAITQLRYAETLLALGELDNALSEANNDLPSSFEASQQEILGDIYLAQNKKEAAIQSYNNAWELLRSRQETRAILALKMESLGIVPKPIDKQASLIQEPSVVEQPMAPEASGNTTTPSNTDADATLSTQN